MCVGERYLAPSRCNGEQAAWEGCMRSGIPSAQGGFPPPCAKPRGRRNCPAGAVVDRQNWRVGAAPSGEAGAVGLRRRGEVGEVRRRRYSRRRVPKNAKPKSNNQKTGEREEEGEAERESRKRKDKKEQKIRKLAKIIKYVIALSESNSGPLSGSRSRMTTPLTQTDKAPRPECNSIYS